MRITAHRLAATAALAALLATVLSLSGCSNSGCTCPGEVEDIYPARTSPGNVLEKLNLAYVNMDTDAYLDCLAEDFTFHVNPCDIGDDDWDLPETWNKAVEEAIHRRMFAHAERIRLTLTRESSGYDAGPDPIDSMDDLWSYTESLDLRVHVPGDFTFFANSDQLFVFAIDEDRAASDEEELWEIVEWYDLTEDRKRPVVPSTWSGIKALYR